MFEGLKGIVHQKQNIYSLSSHHSHDGEVISALFAELKSTGSPFLLRVPFHSFQIMRLFVALRVLLKFHFHVFYSLDTTS